MVVYHCIHKANESGPIKLGLNFKIAKNDNMEGRKCWVMRAMQTLEVMQKLKPRLAICTAYNHVRG